ncbi:acyltransferase [Mesorhizobium sp. AD1-1]|uniref:acyltransferase family protein n=1 Tax=Mesorhizobium sp. AD1-1 TaxID=2876621 RepID=UPI001CCFD34F|nr:acyltransferase [Mesorhizobium sp. AD1-1]MBZ9720348.1 acyltransferase [Mesorhizobium sp. AD1-1]
MNIEIRPVLTENKTARIDLPGLLAMRCYAALSIVLFHMVWLTKLEIPDYLGFVRSHFGYGVPLFFIVSAFGLCVGYSGKIGSRDDLREYYLRRFLRIAPLFYFMMAFYFPLYWMFGAAQFPTSPFALGYVVSSALFIFNLTPQYVTGYVMASWTIGIEMAFYAILPLLIFAVTDLTRSLIFLAVVVFVTVSWDAAFQGTTGPIAAFGGYSLVGHMVNFAAGIAGYHVWLKLRQTSPLIGQTLFCASLLVIVGLIVFPAYLPGLGGRVAWAMAFAGAVVGISLYPTTWFVNPVAKTLGNASFSLYLWHPVVLVGLERCGLYRAIYSAFSGASVPFFVSTICTLAVLIPLALVSYRYIERPGMGLAKRFSRRSLAGG